MKDDALYPDDRDERHASLRGSRGKRPSCGAESGSSGYHQYPETNNSLILQGGVHIAPATPITPESAGEPIDMRSLVSRISQSHVKDRYPNHCLQKSVRSNDNESYVGRRSRRGGQGHSRSRSASPINGFGQNAGQALRLKKLPEWHKYQAYAPPKGATPSSTILQTSNK